MPKPSTPYDLNLRQSAPLWGAALRAQIAKTPAARPNLIDEILPEQSIIMMASPPGQGKSCLLLTMVCQASLGHPVFDHLPCVRPLRIYILCPERASLELIERLARMAEVGIPFGDSLCIDGGMVGRCDIANPTSVKEMIEGMRRFAAAQNPPGIDLICFEGMYGMSRKPLASEEAANDFARFNAMLQHEFKCALWYSHHTRKASRCTQTGEELPLVWFGSQMLMAQVTGAYIFEREKGSKLKSKITNQKDTVSGLVDELHFDFDAESFTLGLAHDLGLFSSLERLRFFVNGCHSTGRMFTYQDICTSTDLGHSSVKRFILTQVKAGCIENCNKPGVKALYRVLAPVPTQVRSNPHPYRGGCGSDPGAEKKDFGAGANAPKNGSGEPDFSAMDEADLARRKR